jgi:hypothetical protein
MTNTGKRTEGAEVSAALWVLVGAAMIIAAFVWAIVEERDHRWNAKPTGRR